MPQRCLLGVVGVGPGAGVTPTPGFGPGVMPKLASCIGFQFDAESDVGDLSGDHLVWVTVRFSWWPHCSQSNAVRSARTVWTWSQLTHLTLAVGNWWPQCQQILASARTVSAHSGHRFIADGWKVEALP